MGHYAKITDGRVMQVIVADADFFKSFVDNTPGQWLQTSYNTRGNMHYGNDGKPDGGIAVRGNFACVGDVYDPTHDVFYSPQPFPSWALNTSTWTWEAPVKKPNDGKSYLWSEDSLSWVS